MSQNERPQSGQGVAYCRYCGTQIDQSARFCFRCGAPTGPQRVPTAATTGGGTRQRQQRYSPMKGVYIAVIVVVVILLIAALFSAGFFAPFSRFPGTVVGSGNLATRQQSFAGFTTVAIGSGFKFNIAQSSSYSVKVTIDDNVLNYVQVTQAGNTLSVGLAPGYTYQSISPKVEITMPDVSRLDISGGASGTASGFDLSHDLTVVESGGSTMSVSGGGSLNLTIDVSGGSRLDMSGLPVANARADLSGGSQATVNLNGRLDANVSGGSRLFYVGNPTMGDINISGGATVSKR